MSDNWLSCHISCEGIWQNVFLTDVYQYLNREWLDSKTMLNLHVKCVLVTFLCKLKFCAEKCDHISQRTWLCSKAAILGCWNFSCTWKTLYVLFTSRTSKALTRVATLHLMHLWNTVFQVEAWSNRNYCGCLFLQHSGDFCNLEFPFWFLIWKIYGAILCFSGLWLVHCWFLFLFWLVFIGRELLF